VAEEDHQLQEEVEDRRLPSLGAEEEDHLHKMKKTK
jgi:hypothetical protein